jgi:hypothetical protein
MITWLSIAAVAVIAFLAKMLFGRFGSDRIAKFNEQRRATSRMVSPGELVDANHRVPVALAVSQSTFFYENADTAGSIDLDWVNEIEYDTELSTGAMVEGGRVLRLRSHSQTFEFILPNDVVARWHMMLPPRRTPESSLAPTVLAPQVAAAT